jgi:hypothetical protein
MQTMLRVNRPYDGHKFYDKKIETIRYLGKWVVKFAEKLKSEVVIDDDHY